MGRHRAPASVSVKPHVIRTAMMAAVEIVVVVVAALVGLAGCAEPPPAPRPWCVDRVHRVLLDDMACARDWDGDGYADGEFYFPLAGMVRPGVGGVLPAEVKLDGSTHRRVLVVVQSLEPSPPRRSVRPAGPVVPVKSAGGSVR